MRRLDPTRWARRALTALLAFAAATTATAGGPTISGPTNLTIGDAARYKIRLAGDAVSGACDVTLTVEVPTGFEYLGSRPAGNSSPENSSIVFPRIAHLRAGESLAFEIDLLATRSHSGAGLCVTAQYGSCPARGNAPFQSGPACTWLNVAANAASPPLPENVDIPCIKRPPTHDGVISPGEYTGAAITTMIRDKVAAPNTVTIYAYHDDTTLYIAWDLDDRTNDGKDDRLNIMIDANDNRGKTPDTTDRRYKIRRDDIEEAWIGLGTNTDGGKWRAITGGLWRAKRAARSGGWAAEFEILLADLNGLTAGRSFGVMYGFHAHADPDHWTSYPTNSNEEEPDTWAPATLGRCGPMPAIAVAPGCQGAPIPFADASTGTPTSWAWNFGDGSAIGTTQNPTHVYAAKGSYPVTLSACNSDGCNTTQATVIVWGVPIPDFAANPALVCTVPGSPAGSTLSASALVEPGTIISSNGYAWATDLGAVGTSPFATNNLAVPADVIGTASVTLTATDSRGCSASITKPVNFNLPPTAAIVATPARLCMSPTAIQPILLDASGSLAGTAPIASSAYSFTTGGLPFTVSGATATIWLPPSQVGTINACVAVTDTTNCRSNRCTPVEVLALPTPRLGVVAPLLCTDDTQPITIDLDASTSTSPNGLADPGGFGWTASAGVLQPGNGSRNSLTIAPGYAGTATVQLAVTDNETCGSTLSQAFTIKQGPRPAFTASRTTLCSDPLADMWIDLDASATTSTGTIPNPGGYNWTADFGSMVSSTSQLSRLRLPAGFAGTVTVQLAIVDADRCSRSISKTIVVHLPPDPVVAASPATRCSGAAPTSFRLDATGTIYEPGATGSNWLWTVPPGFALVGTGDVVSVLAPAGSVGRQTILLDVTDSNTCTAQKSFEVENFAPPRPALVVTPAATCSDSTVPIVLSLDASGTTIGNAPIPVTGFTFTASVGTINALNDTAVVTVPAGFSGPITLCVTATDTNTCSAQRCEQAVIEPTPTPVVTASVAQRCTDLGAPMVIDLDASASIGIFNNPGGFTWSTTAGTLSPGQTPLNRLTLPPGFTGPVHIDVTTNTTAGCPATTGLDIVIHPLPQTRVTVLPPGICVNPNQPPSFLLDAVGTLFPPGTGASVYRFQGPAGHSFITSGARATWTVPAGVLGTFTASIEAEDSRGCIGSTTVSVDVFEAAVAMLSPTARVCTDESQDFSVPLDASASVIPAGSNPTWLWTTDRGVVTGSGATADLRLPAGTTGPVRACLEINLDNACVSRACSTIEVTPLPIPNLDVSLPRTCSDDQNPLIVGLDASRSSPGDPVFTGTLGFAWSTSAGTLNSTTGASNSLSLPPGFAGAVDVTVVVSDASGCAKAERKSFMVSPGPGAVIESVAATCTDRLLPFTVALDGSRSQPSTPGGTTSYAWTSTIGSFADPSLAQPQLTLPAGWFGTVSVDLRVTDTADGCSRAASINFEVWDVPSVSLVPAVAQICASANTITVNLDASASSSSAGIDPTGFTWSATVGSLGSGAGSVQTLTIPAGYSGPIDVTVSVRDRNRCEWSRSERIEVLKTPEPQVKLDGDLACPSSGGTDFQFDALASASYNGRLSYRWTAPRGVLSASNAARTTLNLPPAAIGPTVVTLELTDAAGCRAVIDRTVTLREPPIAGLSITSNSVCTMSGQSATVRFDASSSSAPTGNSIISYAWDTTGPVASTSGGGRTLTAVYPPGTNGTYAATVVVTDSAGCTSAATLPFSVREDSPPIVDVGATATAICSDPMSPTTFDLDASGSRGVPPATLANLVWIASRGTLAPSPFANRRTLTLPAGQYGPVRVTVQATDSKGCVESKDIDLRAFEPPLAIATATPAQACEVTPFISVALDGSASASRHPSDPTLRYRWQSSEGTLLTPLAAMTTLEVSPRSLARSAIADLVVIDAAGCRSLPATVTTQLDPSPTAVILAAVAYVGQNSSFSAGAPMTSGPHVFSWDFGDGATAIGASVVHAFAARGAYLVTLRVSDAAGCDSTTVTNVSVGEELIGTLDANVSCAGAALGLSANVTGGDLPYSYAWNFGDGVSVVAANGTTSHVYSTSANYAVTLRVTDAGGQELRLGATAVVHPLPTLTAGNSGPGVAGLDQNFAATSTSTANFGWTFSDGSTAPGANVVHTFVAPGPASATVTAIDGNGCSNRATTDLFLAPPSPTLSLTKAVNLSRANAGDQVEYVVHIANGSSPVTSVRVQDALPPGFSYVPGSLRVSGATLAEPSPTSVLLFSAFDLPRDTSVTLRYRTEIALTTTTGDYSNRASLTAIDAARQTLSVGPSLASVHVDGQLEEPRLVDLAITKSADADPEPPVAGGLVRYRIGFSNRGGIAATAVRIVDDFPKEIATVVENGDAGVVHGGRIEWTIASLPPGAYGSLQYTLRLRDDLNRGTAVRNFVAISSHEPDGQLSNNRASSEVAVGGAPDLVLTKSVVTDPSSATAGATATYSLTWRNAGAGFAGGAVVTDDYDETKLEIVSPPAGGSDSGGVLRIPLGDVAPGDSGVITYTARVREGAAGTIANVADASSTLADQNPADNHAEARFDVIQHDALVTLSAELDPTRGCQRPQVEIAVRGEAFDTATAMYAVTEMIAAAARLGQMNDDVFVGSRIGPLQSARLQVYAALNLRSLFLDSGMGLPYHGDAGGVSGAIAIPFHSAHPVFPQQRSVDEPWCRHEVHYATSGAAIGNSLSAIAAFASDAPAGDHDVSVLVGEAAEAVTIVTAWYDSGFGRAATRLPERLDLPATPAGAHTLSAISAEVHPGHEAALAKGLLRIAAFAIAHPEVAPDGLRASATALGLRVARDLATATDPLVVHGAIDAWTVAESAELLPLLAATGDPMLTASLEAAVRAAASQIAQPSLRAKTYALRIALALGDRAEASRVIATLESAEWLDSRLGIYREQANSAEILYTPETFAGLVNALTSLAANANGIERPALIERLSQTIDRVALEAGLQTGLIGRDHPADDFRLILGSDGGVRIAALGVDGAHSMAPVMVENVKFVGQALSHRDRSLVAGARGIREQNASVAFLSAQSGACRSARVELEDRRFHTETGLFALRGLERAADALIAGATSVDAGYRRELAAELRATASGDRTTLAMFSGMGIRLGYGTTNDDPEDQILERYARVAGLESVPAGLLPVWLELGAGDPLFPEAINPTSLYSSGWDTNRFEATLTTAALGQALYADTRLIARATGSDDRLAKFVALVRLHAATLKVEHLEHEFNRNGDVAGWTPVLDAAGRPVTIGTITSKNDLRGVAALLDGVAAYREVTRRERIQTLGSAGSLPPIASAAAERLTARLLARVIAGLAQTPDDPIALAYCVDALTAAAALDPANRTLARKAATRAADQLANLPNPSPALSPLTQAALTLSAIAATGADDAAIRAAFSDFVIRFYDSEWRLLRPTLEVDPFVLTDMDVGSALSAIAAALPHLLQSQSEQAVDLLHAVGVRMLTETGLQRDHRLEVVTTEGIVTTRAPQLSSSVRFTLTDTTPQSGVLYPGDMVRAAFTATNPIAGSAASNVQVHVTPGAALRYVSGSTRVDGKPAPDPSLGDSLTFTFAALGGEQSAAVSYLLRVDENAKAGDYQVSVRATAKSQPGANGNAIEAPTVNPNVSIANFGSIEGRVWLDGNGDGRPGADESGVAEVTLLLDDGTAATTDREGNFKFASLQPASYRLTLAETSLPGQMTATAATVAKLTVKPGESANQQFAVTAAAVVTGIAYRDENGNRRRDADEEVVAGVVVETDSGRQSVTDLNGRYLIRAVAIGQHQLRIATRQPYVKDGADLAIRPLPLPAPGVAEVGRRASR